MKREHEIQGQARSREASPVVSADDPAIVRECDTCGNTYDKTFKVIMGHTTGTFDSFECAAQAMAPNCENCGCRILGHGVESDGMIYCCAHCARAEGERQLVDRA